MHVQPLIIKATYIYRFKFNDKHTKQKYLLARQNAKKGLFQIYMWANIYKELVNSLHHQNRKPNEMLIELPEKGH